MGSNHRTQRFGHERKDWVFHPRRFLTWPSKDVHGPAPPPAYDHEDVKVERPVNASVSADSDDLLRSLSSLSG